MQKTIFIVTYQQYTTRYLLQTDIFNRLKEQGHKIVIISPNGNDERFHDDYGGDNIFIEQFNYDAVYKTRATFLYQFFLKIRRFTFFGDLDISTLDSKETFLRQTTKNKSVLKRIKILMPLWISYLLRSSRVLRAGVDKLEDFIFNNKNHEVLFDKYKPDLMILADLGTIDISNLIMREARSHKVPILSIILSWDNLTAKGRGAVKPDYAIAWNDNMKWELENYHHIPASRSFVGGIAHFDGYFRDGYVMSNAEFKSEFSIDGKNKVLLYGTASPTFFNENRRIITLIINAVRSGELPRDLQLIVRPHPAYTLRNRTTDKDELLEIRQLCLDNDDIVVLNMPELHPRDHGYEIDPEEQRRLSSALKHSAILITQYSTLMLEGAIFDTPIINVGFDEFGGFGIKSHEIGSSFTHLKRVLEVGFTRDAHDEEEFIDLINMYLENPETDSKARAIIREREGGPNKGRAGVAIADHIYSILNDGAVYQPPDLETVTN